MPNRSAKVSLPPSASHRAGSTVCYESRNSEPFASTQLKTTHLQRTPRCAPEDFR